MASVSALCAQGGGPARPTAARRGPEGTHDFLGLGRSPDPVAAARGEKLYVPNCSFCHGMKASGGDTGPDLLRSTLVLHDDKGELIGPFVHKGRPDRGMPPFAQFTDLQLADIAEFLHMRVELIANRGTYKVLNVLTGNAAEGQKYFNGAGGCTACHSVSGDLAHIGSKKEPVDLQQTFLYPSTKAAEGSKPEPDKVTVSIPGQPPLSGTLKQLDDFNVSLYDTNGEYRSFPIRGGIRVAVEDKLRGHRDLLNKYTDADIHNLLAYLVTLK